MNLCNGRVELAEPVKNGESISVLLAGDFCPIKRTGEAVLAGGAGQMVKSMAPMLAEADLSIVNLEAPLTRTESPIPKTGPNLKGEPECAAFLVEAGFQVANLANNHIRDMGDQGVLDTIDVLKDRGIETVGAGRNLEAALQPLSLQIRGRRIAILAYAENEFSIADSTSAGAANLDSVANLEQIQRVSAEYELTLVLVHGGNEYCPIPSPGMRRRYRALARAGATAVVATHTHCPQGMEVVDGVPIIYSMGNFLFDSPWEGKAYSDQDLWWKGYLVKLNLVGPRVVSVELVPYASGPDGSSVRIMGGSERSAFLNYLNHLSDLIEDDTRLQNLWNAWCLTQGPSWLDAFRRARFPVSGEEAEMDMMVLRNGFTCEAHREVATTFLRMICENRTEAAEMHRKELEDLQKGIWG